MQLNKLQDIQSIEKFNNEVVENVKTQLKKEVSTNEGLKDEEEILTHIRKGKNVNFSYDVLIKCSEEL
jgi:vacuolar-type H+-ATPase subunit I/STV1